MKKITLFLLILGTLAFGDSKVYTGVGYALVDLQTKDVSFLERESALTNAARVKIGYGRRDAYAIELSLEYIESTPERLGFDISLLKAFDWDIYVNPFVKAGFGAGTLHSTDNSEHSLRYGSFNFGGGLFLPLGEHFDIELAYEYKNLSYQKEHDDAPSSGTGDANTLYIGVNIRY